MVESVRLKHPVYLVRHGRTALNAAGRFQGRIDEPLDDIGHEQSRVLARKVSYALPENEIVELTLFSSPLRRARETAAVIASEIGRSRQNVSVSDQIAEMSFGCWEGLTTAQVKEKYPLERKRRKANRWDFAPAGGESYAELAARAEQWLRGLGGPVLAITHLGVMRVAAVVAGGRERGDALKLLPEPDEIWRFGEGGPVRIRSRRRPG